MKISFLIEMAIILLLGGDTEVGSLKKNHFK